jgi:hypothetical protein
MLITFVYSDLLELFRLVIPNKDFRISTFGELLGFPIGVSLTSFLALDLCLLRWLCSITAFEAHQELICF